ncbi:1-phosphofructokinase family hexose kinase [Parafilimonas sp.]|uniref:1-phosphofructokinase family hexose kinase n=1 Tax=Parafilimonas sp. TaxID=1969739 RepID=UPI003F7F004B
MNEIINMPAIVTITFNPCIDKSSSVDVLLPDKKLRCTAFKNEAGGGGINVARAIKKLGGDALAIYLGGGYTGVVLQNLLKAESIAAEVIDTGIDTRENIMIVDKATNFQYRFITPGHPIEETHWKQCLALLENMHSIEYLVVSGSMQPGFPQNIFERIAVIAKQKKAKLILDIPAEALSAHTIKDVFILKPNLNELSMLAGKEELLGDEITTAARSIISKNICEVVIVSMGAAGALLVTKDIAEQFMAPPVKRKSTVGAGDSMVAGIVTYLSAGKDIREAVRYGIACGTAATLNEGTQLCNIKDVTGLYQLMQQYEK